MSIILRLLGFLLGFKMFEGDDDFDQDTNPFS